MGGRFQGFFIAPMYTRGSDSALEILRSARTAVLGRKYRSTQSQLPSLPVADTSALSVLVLDRRLRPEEHAVASRLWVGRARPDSQVYSSIVGSELAGTRAYVYQDRSLAVAGKSRYQ